MKESILLEAFGHKYACLLVSNHQEKYKRPQDYYNFDSFLGFADVATAGGMEVLEQYLAAKAVHFGALTYEARLLTEYGTTRFGDANILFPKVSFFKPEKPIKLSQAELNKAFQNLNLSGQNAQISFSGLMTKGEYISKVEQVKELIAAGTVYELNLCMEFVAENVELNPLAVFKILNKNSAAPFAALYKYENKWVICASPERFLKKTGNSILSQPIKGTAPRGANETEDLQLASELQQNIKERAENVMIVDLVRNDFAKSCKPGTVQVPDLFGVYSFNTVHQMISTVTGEMRDNCTPSEALKNAYPMGSMTGAPKIKALEIIDELEVSPRGIYSGSIGYLDENGNFDFNVVIRTLVYDADAKTLSYHVGSAITYDSDPELEYQECMLKGNALLKALADF